jgi:hypothetical protein
MSVPMLMGNVIGSTLKIEHNSSKFTLNYDQEVIVINLLKGFYS